MNNAYSYQPSDVRTTEVASGAPTDPTYVGGAGLTYPQNYVNGTPVDRANGRASKGRSANPRNGLPGASDSVSDPGSWFCPSAQNREMRPDTHGGDNNVFNWQTIVRTLRGR